MAVNPTTRAARNGLPTSHRVDGWRRRGPSLPSRRRRRRRRRRRYRRRSLRTIVLFSFVFSKAGFSIFQDMTGRTFEHPPGVRGDHAS